MAQQYTEYTEGVGFRATMVGEILCVPCILWLIELPWFGSFIRQSPIGNLPQFGTRYSADDPGGDWPRERSAGFLVPSSDRGGQKVHWHQIRPSRPQGAALTSGGGARRSFIRFNAFSRNAVSLNGSPPNRAQ